MRHGFRLFTGAAAVALLSAACGLPTAPVTRRSVAPAVLLIGLGHLHHPIATPSAQAQAFFDQGLTFVYAFNFLEAVHSFQRAAELDPRSPMPYWGIALARGPSFNAAHVNAARERLAYVAIQRALTLASTAPENEQAYVAALARRFSGDPDTDQNILAKSYAQAMRGVYEHYPDDPDAATLYAESLMDLHAWNLWTSAGLPNENTDQVLTVLRSVLRRWPDHLGANHYYVHALEASPHPELALASAARLATLAPAAGHLVHMPAHLFMRTGDYAAAAAATEAARVADNCYLSSRSIVNAGYVSGYAEHNLQFMASAASMDGDYRAAFQAATELATEAGSSPSGQTFRSTLYFVLIRFARWKEILELPEPAAQLPAQRVFWHYARGSALAGTGQPQAARAELLAMEVQRTQLPPETEQPMLGAWRFLGPLAGDCLMARIASAEGNYGEAIVRWQAAAAVQDLMPYHEPPAWYPVRESLGAAFMRNGQPGAAEATLHQELARYPRDPRALFGLSVALSAEHKAAARVAEQFRHAWQGGPARPRIQDM